MLFTYIFISLKIGKNKTFNSSVTFLVFRIKGVKF